ncbi:MAG: M15 family metallopeptidase [Bacteroidia bacterium]|nr:M15 family metallopeptidase [Bacteroidia bacterium]
MKNKFAFLFYIFLIVACNSPVTVDTIEAIITDDAVEGVKLEAPVTADSIKQSELTKIELAAIDAGLVDIQTIDSSVVLDLKYATENNFIGVNMYGNFNKCYLLPEVAQKIKNAQTLLRKKFPYYSLIIYDGARPKSIQYKMWTLLDMPHFEKLKYVSNPESGSLHNYGAAVDISIIDANGYELDMGTPYDYFGDLAYPKEEERLLKEGKLTVKQLNNRLILREIMEISGFMPITTEWWHFNFCTKKEAAEKYTCLE